LFCVCAGVSRLVPQLPVHSAADTHRHAEALLDGGVGVGIVDVGQQIEDVLQVVDDLMIHDELARDHKLEVFPDLDEPRLQAAQRRELRRDARRERADRRRVANVAQQVLDADLLGLLCNNGGWHVRKGLLRRCAVLDSSTQASAESQNCAGARVHVAGSARALA
jgi:hypothetical protein